MSLGTTEGWPGTVIICNWYVDSLSICHFTRSASIAEYWQGIMSVLIDFLILIWLSIYWCPHQYGSRNYSRVVWCWYIWQLVSGQFEYMPLHYKCFHQGEYWQGMVSVLIHFLELILLRTYWCPHHYEFRNHRGGAWSWFVWQLVFGQFEHIPLHYKCFHRWVLAKNNVSFDWYPDFDPSKNILMPKPLWVQEPQRGGLVLICLAIGIWTVWVYATSLQVLPSLSIGKE